MPDFLDTQHDPVLYEISKLVEPFEYDKSHSVFYDLVSSIADQQIHYRSRGVYLKKLIELLNGEIPTPELLLSLDPHEFAKKKIASNKLKAYKNLATHWIENNYDSVDWHGLDDESVREKLTTISGIGEWTADMILLFTLERKDIFNPKDHQLKKAMIEAYDLAEGPNLEREMTHVAEAWRPERSLGVKYLISYRGYTKKR